MNEVLPGLHGETGEVDVGSFYDVFYLPLAMYTMANYECCAAHVQPTHIYYNNYLV